MKLRLTESDFLGKITCPKNGGKGQKMGQK